jgi:hypothetical protein
MIWKNKLIKDASFLDSLRSRLSLSELSDLRSQMLEIKFLIENFSTMPGLFFQFPFFGGISLYNDQMPRRQKQLLRKKSKKRV